MRELGSHPVPRTQQPSEALADDGALLDEPPGERWYTVRQPAVVLGLALHRRAAEIVVGKSKLVGFAQVRRRHAALFQVGILLRDQSRLADFMRVPDVARRAVLRATLKERSVGLEALVQPLPSVPELVAALSPDPAAS